MRILKAFPVSAALAVLLIAPFTARAATPRACELLSAKTAASLVGGPTTAAMDSGFMCFYSSTKGDSQATLSVSDGSGQAGPDFMRRRGGAVEGNTTESIADLGDLNLLVVRASTQNTLTVFIHGEMLVLTVNRRMSPELKAAMVQAMTQMVAKI